MPLVIKELLIKITVNQPSQGQQSAADPGIAQTSDIPDATVSSSNEAERSSGQRTA
jgi:hypothetical protein